MNHQDKINRLTELSLLAIKRLQELPQPVVRVSGPLTSGGYGYEENLRRFKIAQEKLKNSGYTVFDYFEEPHNEALIVELDMRWQEVMEYYHRPIMETRLMSAVFMMPRWQESNGAKLEYEYAIRLGLEIEEIPEGWF